MPEKTQKCRSCGADVIWIDTAAGKKHIVNAKPKKMFVLPFSGNGYEITDCYETHFATCPQAKEWRKPRATN